MAGQESAWEARAEEQAVRRERKRRPPMPVTGKSVFELNRLIQQSPKRRRRRLAASRRRT